MEERYEPLKELGSGNFGVARLVRDRKTKELFAIKYIERGNKVMRSTCDFVEFCFFVVVVVVGFLSFLLLLLIEIGFLSILFEFG